jgi:hypothetical protein
MTDRSFEDVRDGVGLAAYLILLELLALLEGLGVEAQAVTGVVSRARQVAEHENDRQASPAFEVAWQLLRGLESGRTGQAPGR